MLRHRRWWLRWRRLTRVGGGRFALRSFRILQHGVRTRVSRSGDRESYGRQYEYDCGPCSRPRQSGGCATRSEGGLAAHAAECSGYVPALATLQQHNYDQKKRNNNMDNRDKYNHSLKVSFQKSFSWCGRGDLNPHAFRRHPLKMVCLPVPPLPQQRFDYNKAQIPL